MKYSLLFLSTLFCLLVFTACDKKQRAIDNLNDFVEKVEKNAPDYTDEEWTAVNNEYDELIVEIDKYEYSSEETKRIAKLKGKFIGIKAKDTANDIIDGADKTIQEVGGIIEGIKDGILSNKLPPLTNETDSIESTE